MQIQTRSIFYVVLLFLVRQMVFEIKYEKLKKILIFQILEHFLFTKVKKICNLYFRELFFKHLRRVAYTEMCQKDKKKFLHIFSVWYVMNVSWKLGTEIRKNIDIIYIHIKSTLWAVL